jgi:glycosyltransferase involved in cell wall biosynthesis
MSRVLVPPPRDPLEPLAEAPTFSIVIPAYQAAETIGDSISSALAQVHPPHEIIVVDDGSTDDLEAALASFGDRLTVIHKQNGGAASARNTGASAATGEYLALLDADDTYHPRRLESLADLARTRPDLDLVTTDSRFVVGGRAVGSFNAENPFPVENQRAAILQSCFVGGWPATRLARLREIGGFDETLRISHDWDCALRLILDGSQAGLVDEPYYDYRLHPGSLTASRVASLWDRVRLLEKAEKNPALVPDERPVLTRSLRLHRSRAVVAETEAALSDSLPRRRLARLAVSSGVGLRARMLAALAAVSPPLARSLAPHHRPPEDRFTSPRP